MRKGKINLINRVAAVVLLMVVGLLAYWPGIYGGFIFDDYANLALDPDWKVTTLDWPAWHRALMLGISSASGRPLAMLSFALNYFFFGESLIALKAVNIAMHALCGALLFLLVRRLTDHVELLEHRTHWKTPTAAIVALLWILHPIQVSTVLYVVQRMEMGAALGTLLCLVFYLAGRDRQISGKLAWPWLAGSAASLAIGLGFKETAILSAGYAFLIELFILRFQGATRLQSRFIPGIYFIGLVASSFVFFFYVAPPYFAADAYSGRDFDVIGRLSSQPGILCHYLSQMALPLPERFSFYYDNLRPPSNLISLRFIASCLVLLLMLASAWAMRKKWPLYALGITWFFVAHSLTSNVIPLELAFEHRNYLALAGILIAAISPALAVLERLNWDAALAIASSLVLAVGILCLIQAYTWGAPLRLALALDARNPESPRAVSGLGSAFYDASAGDPDSPLFSMAIRQYERAVKLWPPSASVDQSLITLEACGKRVPTSAQWDSLRVKLKARPAGPPEITALYGLIVSRAVRRCDLDPQQIYLTFVVALERNPRSEAIHTLYANMAYNVLGDPALAIRTARAAVQLAPNDLQAKVNLARFLGATNPKTPELQSLIREISGRDTLGQYTNELSEHFKPMSEQPGHVRDP